MSTNHAECDNAASSAGTSININAKHFIGTGSHAWLIVGSIPGTDSDQAYLVLAEDQDQAQTTFRNQLFSNRNMNEQDSQGLIERYDTDIMFTQIDSLS